MLLCLLAACAISVAGPPTASAQFFYTLTCAKSSFLWGAFTTSGCTTTSAFGGNWAPMYMPTYGKRIFCLYLGAGFGLYADGYCTVPEIGGPFMLFDPESKTKIGGKTYAIKAKISGLSTETTCSEMSAKEPEVEGGKEEKGKEEDAHMRTKSIEFNGCKVVKPAGVCEVSSKGSPAGTIATGSVTGELVESSAGKLEYLFAPTEGTTFAELELKGTFCTIKGTTIAGSMLTSVGPENEESESGTLKSEPTNRAYKVGEKSGKAELKIGGEPATITGTATEVMTLDSFEITETEDPELKGAKIPEETIDFEEK
jgi:hypothetical protein